MFNIALLSSAALLVLAPHTNALPTRSLLQGDLPFWADERRVTNSSDTLPYSTTIVGHTEPTFDTASFAACYPPGCPTAPKAIAYRLCFASQSATVTLSTTLSSRSVHSDTELYVFAVENDIPPTRNVFTPTDWTPPYTEFFTEPPLTISLYDDNSAASCSSDLAPTVDVCAANATCTPTATGVTCPAGTTPRLLSSVNFQLCPDLGEPYQCMYAVIGAKDAPADVAELSFGLDIVLSEPKATLPGECAGNPRVGPFDLRDLGIGPMPPAASAEPLVEPAWLSLTDAVASGCDANCTTPSNVPLGEAANAPMFVYENLCVEQEADAEQTAVIRTRYGGTGPTDTTLYVFNEARSVNEWNDAGRLICADGSEPSKDNCGPDQVCKSQHDKCKGDVKLWSLSEVEVPIPKGMGPTCFSAAIGVKEGQGQLLNVGVDVLLLGEDGEPAKVLNVTTELLPNGTAATTTTVTYPNGTSTSSTEILDPSAPSLAPPLPANDTAGGPAAAPSAAPSEKYSGGALYPFSQAIDSITGAFRRRLAGLQSALFEDTRGGRGSWDD